MEMDFYFSNRIDSLRDSFLQEVVQKEPFQKPLVIVPHSGVRHFLQQGMVDATGICLGTDFQFLFPSLTALLGLFFPELRIPTAIDLFMAVQKELEEIMDNETDDPLWTPLIDYIRNKKHVPHFVPGFCQELAGLFMKYSFYVRSLSQEEKGTDWQSCLRQRIFRHRKHWKTPYDFLDQTFLSPKHIRPVYIFGFSFLPEIYLDLFDRIAHHMPVRLYRLSPSYLFWTDFLTPYEEKKWIDDRRKKGVNPQEIRELKDYLKNTNPLLVSWGKMNREFGKTIEKKTENVRESYWIPARAYEHPVFSDYLSGFETGSTDEPFSLLQAVQLDILSLRHPQEIISFEEKEAFIQLHEAPSPERETEILYYNIVSLLSRNPDVKPGDILVAAPRMEDYLPYIEHYFHNFSPDYRFTSSSHSLKKSVLRDVRILITLGTGRWEKDFLFDFMSSENFKRNQEITEEELALWLSWAEEAGITWGYDAAHQKAVLGNEYEKNVHLRPEKTWMEGMNILLDYLCFVKPENSFEEHLQRMDFSHFDSFNKLHVILFTLREKTEPMYDGSRKTMREWKSYLIELIKSFFPDQMTGSSEGAKRIEKILRYTFSSEDLENYVFPFSVFHYLLQKDSDRREEEESFQPPGTIRFTDLHAAEGMSRKVHYILGMNEDCFPKKSFQHPLCFCKEYSSVDYYPDPADRDRSVFLELLMAAKRYFFVSYQKFHPENFKKMIPSVVLEEFLDYLDHFYERNGKKPSDTLVTRHSAFNFDYRYFLKKNFFAEAYPAALSFYGPKKREMRGKDFFAVSDKPFSFPSGLEETETTVEIRDLSLLAGDPFRFYLLKNYSLSHRGSFSSSDTSPFLLSPLQKAIWRKKIFTNVSRSSDSKRLPRGFFTTLNERILEKESLQTIDFLRKEGFNEDDFFSLELREDAENLVRIEDRLWMAPPVKVDLGKNRIKIVGLFENFSLKGYISFKRYEKGSIFAEWPMYLLQQRLSECFFFRKGGEKWLFPRSQKMKEIPLSHPGRSLAYFLQYRHFLLEQAFFLFPDWIPSLLKGNFKPFEEEESFSSDPWQNIIKKEMLSPSSVDRMAAFSRLIYGENI